MGIGLGRLVKYFRRGKEKTTPNPISPPIEYHTLDRFQNCPEGNNTVHNKRYIERQGYERNPINGLSSLVDQEDYHSVENEVSFPGVVSEDGSLKEKVRGFLKAQGTSPYAVKSEMDYRKELVKVICGQCKYIRTNDEPSLRTEWFKPVSPNT